VNGMATTIWVKLNHEGIPYEITDYVKRIDIWKKVSDRVGLFAINLMRDATLDLTKFFAQQTIKIRVEAADSLLGYLDKGKRKSESVKDVLEQTYNVRGRDVGQDLNNKQVDGHWKKQPADDIVDNMLSTSGSEITFTSPGTAPQIPYDCRDKFLVEGLAEILQEIDYEGRVKDDKSWDMWQIGTRSSGITLKAVAGETDNNILNLERTDFDGLPIRNYIVVRGRRIDDTWSDEESLSYWTYVGDNVLTQEYVNIKRGVAALKNTVGASTKDNPTFRLLFPQLNFTSLNWSVLGTDVLDALVYCHTPVPQTEIVEVIVRLRDTSNNVISIKVTRDRAKWQHISVPIGIDVEIGSGSLEEGRWNFTTGSTFTWIVDRIDIILLAGVTGDYMILDGFRLPNYMVAIAQDSTSQTSYWRRDYSYSRTDLYSQAELQKAADTYLANRKDPIDFIEVTAVGSAGIVSETLKWIPGYTVVVNSPDDGINSVTYRMIEIHMIITERPERDGFDFIVVLKLAKYQEGIDSEAWSMTTEPEVGVPSVQDRRINVMERERTSLTDLYPVIPRPLVRDVHIMDGADIDGTKLGASTLPFDRAKGDWFRGAWNSKKVTIVSAEAIRMAAAYNFDIPAAGDVIFRKNHILIQTGTINPTVGRVYCLSSTIDGSKSPDLIASIRKSSTSNGLAHIGLTGGVNTYIHLELTDAGNFRLKIGGYANNFMTYLADTWYKVMIKYFYKDRIELWINDVLKVTYEGQVKNVDGRVDGAGTGWGLIGASPYIGAKDYPTNYLIQTVPDTLSEDYTFADVWGSTSTVYKTYIYVNAWDIWGIRTIKMEVWDGVGWSSPIDVVLPRNTVGDYAGYVEIDVTSILSTKTKVNAAKVRFRSSTGEGSIGHRMDHVYMLVKNAPCLPDEMLDEVDIYCLGPLGTNVDFDVKYHTVIEDW